jgi:hypothetical protein
VSSRGLHRPDNQDRFLVARLRPDFAVEGTNLRTDYLR